MTESDFTRRRFVCVTFDDGYRDNLEFAYPILKKYDVPFAIYVATSFADRIGELWWLALEAVIAQNEMVGVRLDGRDRWFECRSVEQKRDAVRPHLRLAAPAQDRGRAAQRRARAHRAPSRRHGGVLRRSVHGLEGAGDARRRSAGHHRRPHRQPSDPDQARRHGGARRARQQPQRDRGGARRAAAASRLSGRRPHARPARANSRSPPSSASRPR